MIIRLAQSIGILPVKEASAVIFIMIPQARNFANASLFCMLEESLNLLCLRRREKQAPEE